MAIISEEVTHILFHVDAEGSTADTSQVAGVQVRADQVRSMVASLRNRNDDVTRIEFLDLLRARVRPPDTELLDEINAIDPDDDGEAIRTTLSAWVGKGPRPGRAENNG